MTARDVATYVSIFQARVLAGTSEQYIHVDDCRRFRESFRTDDQWRPGRRLSESAVSSEALPWRLRDVDVAAGRAADYDRWLAGAP